MSSNLNTVLADCERQAKALVEEIEEYRSARELSDQTAASLEKLCVALSDTNEKIKPFTAVVSRRVLIGLGIGFLINLGLLTVILFLLLFR